MKKITIFGGTGFLGCSIVKALVSLDYDIHVVTRNSNHKVQHESVSFHVYDYESDDKLSSLIRGSDVVINLVGILFERGSDTFFKIHTNLTQKIARVCREEGVKKFIHVSALGVDKSESKYGKSKLAAEKAAIGEYPATVILRPSIIFGPDDNFFNMFAKIAKLIPILPLIGGGKTKFQPVYVEDVAEAVKNTVVSESAKEQIFELGGPDIETFKQLFQRLGKEMGRRFILVPLPFPIATCQASIMGLLPHPLLTVDQVRSLKTDNVVSEGMAGLTDLRVSPTSMDKVLPSYLACYKRKQ
ncbi:MAG: complex I NDUFA9 subunit family protein [Alphaproteobacteria bacterium]|nr:complex I NDUFA9 subunit family protein [Alphaproteobacteria bacterium]